MAKHSRSSMKFTQLGPETDLNRRPRHRPGVYLCLTRSPGSRSPRRRPSPAFHHRAKAGHRRGNDAAGYIHRLCRSQSRAYPSLVFRCVWPRSGQTLMTAGGQEVIHADDDVLLAADAQRPKERVRELEQLVQFFHLSSMS